MVESKGVRKWRRVRQIESEKISLTRRCRGCSFFPSNVRSSSLKLWAGGEAPVGEPRHDCVNAKLRGGAGVEVVYGFLAVVA